MLRTVAGICLQDPNVPMTAQFIEQLKEKEIQNVITIAWVQAFCDRYNITNRRRTGNTTLNEAQRLAHEKQMAYRLGCMKRDYDAGTLDEYCVENLDETHMVCDLDNGRVLDFRGAKRVSYQEVSAAGQVFSIAKIEVPMVILPNTQRNYPINGTPDNIQGVCYRTQPKAWMDKKGFAEYFKEPRTIVELPDGLTRIRNT